MEVEDSLPCRRTIRNRKSRCHPRVRVAVRNSSLIEFDPRLWLNSGSALKNVALRGPRGRDVSEFPRGRSAFLFLRLSSRCFRSTTGWRTLGRTARSVPLSRLSTRSFIDIVSSIALPQPGRSFPLRLGPRDFARWREYLGFVFFQLLGEFFPPSFDVSRVIVVLGLFDELS